MDIRIAIGAVAPIVIRNENIEKTLKNVKIKGTKNILLMIFLNNMQNKLDLLMIKDQLRI